MKIDYKAFLSKIPKLQADGHLRYSGIILEGRPGIGKTSFATDAVPNVTKDRIVRIPMATRTYEEFGAFPFPVTDSIDTTVTGEDGKTKSVKKNVVRVEQALSEVSIEPLLEENIGDNYGILILDDVTLTDPRLQNALLELIQFGVIANRRLGKNVVTFLTGNKTDDGAYAIEWSAPLVGRCVKIELEPDFDNWLDYSDNQDICPTVVGFLKEFGQWFAPSSGDETYTSEDGRTPSPRDWTRLGRAMYQQGGYRNFQPDFIFKTPQVYAKSMVGEVAAIAYNQYASNFGVYPSSSELFENPSLWDAVPKEKRDMLSGGIAVVFGLRNYVFDLLSKNLADQAKSEAITTKFFQLIFKISNGNSEIIGVGISSLGNWIDENEKERKGLKLVIAKIFISPEFSTNEQFKSFLGATWRYNNKK